MDPGRGGLSEESRERALSIFGVGALSRRERDVVLLMLKGKKPREIAYDLDISVSTVVQHRKHIYTKLDVHSEGQLFYRYICALVGDPMPEESGSGVPEVVAKSEKPRDQTLREHQFRAVKAVCEKARLPDRLRKSGYTEEWIDGRIRKNRHAIWRALVWGTPR